MPQKKETKKNLLMCEAVRQKKQEEEATKEPNLRLDAWQTINEEN